MRYLSILAFVIFFASCSKEPNVEVPQNKMTILASMEINGILTNYTNFTIEKPAGFPLNVITIPPATPLIRIESEQLFEADSINVLSQKVNVRYFVGGKTYVANHLKGSGYIICTRNRNSEVNVNIRDGNGEIKPALKRIEDFEARFTFRVVNEAAPFDTVDILLGKLVRNGYYYVY